MNLHGHVQNSMRKGALTLKKTLNGDFSNMLVSMAIALTDVEFEIATKPLYLMEKDDPTKLPLTA